MEDRCLLDATYYVSPTGNDNNSGTSPERPWRTIDRVNLEAFQAGDTIRFQGGASFSGSLLFYDEAGIKGNPITISTYGNGRATILAGTYFGIFVYNTEGFSISNLNLVGAGMNVNTASGIYLYNDLPGNVELEYFRVNNVEVSGFGLFGIDVTGCNARSGFSDIRITNAKLHHNLYAGLSTVGPFYCYYTPQTRTDARVIRGLNVSRVEAYNNPGINDPNTPSGSGIILSSVNGGVVERSIARDNGNPGGGNVGIWTYNSSNMLFQYNESYRNRTTNSEGGGFDLDFGVVNSVMQYNYSHDNDGQGFYLVGLSREVPGNDPPIGPGNLSNSGNIIRYNISERDGRRNDTGGITVYGEVSNAEIYNNTIYMTPNGNAPVAAIFLGDLTGGNVNFRNNILMTTGTAYLVKHNGLLTAANIRFQGNNYWSSGAPFQISYHGTNYTNLTAWRNAGQEKINGQSVGLNVDPGLTNPGGGGTIGDPDLLNTLTAYKLKSTSPLRNAGLNLRILFGINPGARDFYGNSIPQNGAYSIGAHDS